jgi:uncharacterized protein
MKGKGNPLCIRPKIVIKDTKKYGKGVFADEDIKKGQFIHILSGEKISSNDLIKKVQHGKEKIDDPLQIGKKTYIDLDLLSRSFNHSCNPNAGIRKKSEMFALENIRKGEEITYDYSATIAPTIWNMKCKCGAKNCRKILGDITSIPDKQLIKYRMLGALQDYIKVVLKTIKRDEIGNVILPKYEINALEILSKLANKKR